MAVIMRRIAVFLLWMLFFAPAGYAQLTLTNVGTGGFGGAGAAFSGSGDTLSGAFAYWSCARAYTAAYTLGLGNACDIIRASDSATCTIKFAASGFADVTTATSCAGATVTAFCNGTTCKVTKAYDQSGATNCTPGSVACDASQGTDASRPVLTLSGGPNSNRVCMTFSGGQELDTTATTLNQSMSASMVSERTGATTSYGDVLGAAGGTVQFLYNNVAAQGGIYAGNLGSAQAVAMTDNAYHAIEDVLNSTASSSIVVVDGGATPSLNPGSQAITSATVSIGSGNNPLTGVVCEARLDSIAYNATQYGALNTNQHGPSGYNW